MMHIDTHKAFTKLVGSGLKKEAAETIIGVIEESKKTSLDSLASKQDVKDARNELELKIAGLDLKLANIRIEIKEEIADLKGKFGIMQWMMGFLLIICSGILSKLLFGN